MNVPAESGDMGILSSHVPSIEPLRPGVMEVVENSGSQKWFGASNAVRLVSLYQSRYLVSGGFATVHPNNRLTINVIEAAPLEEFSIEVGAGGGYFGSETRADSLSPYRPSALTFKKLTRWLLVVDRKLTRWRPR